VSSLQSLILPTIRQILQQKTEESSLMEDYFLELFSSEESTEKVDQALFFLKAAQHDQLLNFLESELINREFISKEAPISFDGLNLLLLKNEKLKIVEEVNRFFYQQEQEGTLKLKTANIKPYLRQLLFAVPTSEGLLYTLYYKFYKGQFTFPHSHPQYMSEVILRGDLLEFHLSQKVHGDYELSHSSVHRAGEFTTEYCQCSKPHVVSSKSESCEGIATFLGARMKTISLAQEEVKRIHDSCETSKEKSINF